MIVLVVDDNARMRRTLRSVLSDLTTDVVECDDGAGALQAYERCRPDWVLMDIRMTALDGLEATRRIRAAHPEARVLIVSSFDEPELRAAAREAGASGYVRKTDLMEVRKALGADPDRTPPSRRREK